MKYRGGTQCSAFGCKKRKKKGDRSDSEGSSDEESAQKRRFPRTFHAFPSNQERKKRWLWEMRLDKWVPGKYTRICSDHFLEQDMDRTGQTVRLRDNAVPKRFKNFPQHLKKNRRERKPPRERAQLEKQPSYTKDNDENIEERISPCERTSLEEQRNLSKENDEVQNDNLQHLLDHDYSKKGSPKKTKKQFFDNKTQILKLKRKLKTSQQKCRRLRLRVTSLKSVIKQLREKNSVSSGCGEVLQPTFTVASSGLIKRLGFHPICLLKPVGKE